MARLGNRPQRGFVLKEILAMKKSNALTVMLSGLVIMILVGSCAPQQAQTTPELVEVQVTKQLVHPLPNNVSPTPDPTATPHLPLLAEIPLQPRPDYINGVSPLEYSIVPIEVFEYKNPNYELLGLKDVESGFQKTICVDFLLDTPLVEPGDQLLDSNVISKRMTLFVNGEAMKLTGGGMSMGVEMEFPTIEARWVSGHQTECWEAPLRSGRHEVKFQFRQTSGNIAEYIWYFQISE